MIRKQMEIVQEMVENPVFCTNLYGEMTELSRSGCLELPDAVIKIWGDNGYGKMISRRQDDVNPRTDTCPTKGSGKNGMYYHAGFHDLQASNHLTMSPNSAEYRASGLEMCFANDGTDLLVVNCGSVKPHVYIRDMIAKLWQAGTVDVKKHACSYAATCYGEHEVQIGRLLSCFKALTPLYGVFRDEHAGEQLYHYPARYMIQSLMAGMADKPVGFLRWLTGSMPLPQQAAFIREICT